MKNTNRIKLKGTIKVYLNVSLYMGILLVIVNAGIAFINLKAAAILAIFTVINMLIMLLMLYRNKPLIMNELVSFATEYGQIQRKLLRDLGIPYCLLDDTGRLMWCNNEFETLTHRNKGFSKSITYIFPDITKSRLPQEENETEFSIAYNGMDFRVKCTKVPLDKMAANSDLISAEDYSGFLIAMHFFDETALKLALRENDDQSLAVALLYLDNYDEAMESVEDVRRSLLTALIERKVNKYISSFDGIAKKIEKDKFLIILRKRAIRELMENKFDILEDVKTVNIGNEMAVTISIGAGLGGLTYSQNYEFARTAIDLALGRGGDQAVVKTNDQISYFGGKSQQVEKNTRVKARVKAHALREIISTKDRVLIMGHKNSDVDCFGAAVGIYRIAKSLDKKAYIVIQDPTPSVTLMKELFAGKEEYGEDMFIDRAQAMELAGGSATLVIVDVNKPSLTECPELIRSCKSIVVLDHHRQGSETIENATLSYVEAYASSTCEMVTEILQYISDNMKVRQEEADCLYAGIILDTNNFVSKTGVRTFEAAAFLRRVGADVTRVHKIMRDDANEYRAKAEIISHAVIHRGAYAFSICNPGDLSSPTVIGAQAANELLNIRGIKASFVFTDYDGITYISARSIDEVNVQVIMECMGGGGHLNAAACQLNDTTAQRAMEELMELLDRMIDEGDI